MAPLYLGRIHNERFTKFAFNFVSVLNLRLYKVKMTELKQKNCNLDNEHLPNVSRDPDSHVSAHTHLDDLAPL